MIKYGVLHTHTSAVSLVQRIADVAMIAIILWGLHCYNNEAWTLTSWVSLTGCLVIYQLFSEVCGMYRSWRGIGLISEIRYVVTIWTMSCSLNFFLNLYLINLPSFSSAIVFDWYISSGLCLIGFRVALRLVVGFFRSKGYNRRAAAVVGINPIGFHLAEQLRMSPWLGIHVIGFYDDTHNASPISNNEVNKGTLADLVNDAKSGAIDRVYIALPMSNESQIKNLVSELSDTTCSVLLIPDVFTFNLLHSRSLDINGVPLISIFDTPMVGLNAFIKRIEDIVLAVCIILLISPVLVFISAAVKLTSTGPVIFRQKRYGIDGKPIEVWKFRSMSVMENGDSVIQATKNDTRLTPIGAFLRRTSLDELPQFINVLKGDMSIVGPRPHAVSHNEEYRKLIKGYMLRHKVKPGITGWAQINGWRGETDTLEKMEKRIEFDLEYIRSWSLWFDIKIVFMTIFKGFINKNAY
jgi:putative colanic acid biosynthesis UDP-glucose lipid carrier transferase